MWFENLPIERKLVGVMLLTALCVLVMTCVTLLTYEVHSNRQMVKRSWTTIAEIIATNSGELLYFDDDRLGRETLAGLSAEPEITAAALYNSNGLIQAIYPTNYPLSAFPSQPDTNMMPRFHGRHLTMFRPVYMREGSTRMGTLFLQGDLQGMYRRLGVYSLVLISVFAASVIVAFFVSNVFQRHISQPMLRLAHTARIVSERKDYSIRAKKMSNDELGYLTEAFNSMLEQIETSHSALKESESRLSAALRGKDAFLATLSHELRTPLNPVLLLATEAAANPELPPELRASFETIRKNVELEARLIDDLLDLTRIARGKLSLELRPHDPHAILMDALANVRPDFDQKHIQVEVRMAGGEHFILGDDVRLQQIFWNILKNAVKFTPEGGEVLVETKSLRHERLAISVTDSGIGMTPEELERAFEAFSQGDHAISENGARFGGMGLGLAISRTLVELQKGTIRATSGGRGKGSTFTIEFPLLPGVQFTKKDRIGSTTLLGDTIDPNSRGTPVQRILLVEDHEPTRATLANLLRRRRFKVTTAACLAEAHAAAGQQEFDLLISDIGLPDGSGYDLMMALRDRPGLKGIALSGYGMEQDIARSHEAGFVAHLTKPVRIQTLEVALAAATAPSLEAKEQETKT